MAKNAKKIIRDSIFEAHQEGAKKKIERDKNPDEAYGKIFSHGMKYQLLDRNNDFFKTMENEVKGKSVKEVLTEENISLYLQKKSAVCSQATLDEYRSEMKKIGYLNGVNLEIERVYSTKSTPSKKGAEAVISKADFEKILDYAEKNPSKSGECIRLEALIGIRVSDMAYGITIEADKLRIRSKNGKICWRTITPQISAILNSEAFKSMRVGDKVVAPKDNSLNKYLNRVQDKLGLERHSFHDLRRRIAQDKYDECRASRLTVQESLKSVSLWLNHGEKRDSMLKASYIANVY